MQNTESIIFTPPPEFVRRCHVQSLLTKYQVTNVAELWKKSVADIGQFWDHVVQDTGIEWYKKYSQVVDNSQGIESTRWFIDGKINISHNCVDRHAGLQKTAI